MAYLIDTNVLVRLANAADISHPVAVRAVLELHRRGESLHLTPQVLIEFRNVATRPKSVNGLGLSAVEAEVQAAGFEASFPLFPESPDIYPVWQSVVIGLGIVGKQVHDARLAAVCHVEHLSHLLTFNVGHFSRMANFGPGLAVVDPSAI